MYYIKGLIKKIDKDFVIIENNFIGYKIFTYKTSEFKINNEIKMYIECDYSQNKITYLGIHNYDDIKFVIGLKKIKGIGVKSVIKIMNQCSISKIYQLFKENKVNLEKII